MDYKILIIKSLVTVISFLIFLKINNKKYISKFFVKQFKLSTKGRAFIICVVVYVLLTFITTVINEYLNISNVIMEIMNCIIKSFSLVLFIEISENVPYSDKMWLE